MRIVSTRHPHCYSEPSERARVSPTQGTCRMERAAGQQTFPRAEPSKNARPWQAPGTIRRGTVPGWSVRDGYIGRSSRPSWPGRTQPAGPKNAKMKVCRHCAEKMTTLAKRRVGMGSV
eukprot:gene19842-biopygen8511